VHSKLLAIAISSVLAICSAATAQTTSLTPHPQQLGQTPTHAVPMSEPTHEKPIRDPRLGQGCECPYDRDSVGQVCGGRSAYSSRPFGKKPACFTTDRQALALKLFKQEL
jgi:hypothetical protein